MPGKMITAKHLEQQIRFLLKCLEWSQEVVDWDALVASATRADDSTSKGAAAMRYRRLKEKYLPGSMNTNRPAGKAKRSAIKKASTTTTTTSKMAKKTRSITKAIPVKKVASSTRSRGGYSSKSETVKAAKKRGSRVAK